MESLSEDKGKKPNATMLFIITSLVHTRMWWGDLYTHTYKKEKVVSRQPIFIVNLKSNTMKNTVQI